MKRARKEIQRVEGKASYYIRAILLGVCFGAVSWLLEASVHVLFFSNESLLAELFPSDPNEIWMRLLVAFLFILISLLIHQSKLKHLELNRELLVYQKIVHTMREGLVITDKENNAIYVNPRYTEITGYLPEEALGKNPRLLSSGKQSAAFYTELWQALLDKGYWEGEIWNRNKQGELFSEWISINLLRDSAGEILNYFAIFTDFTSRKEEEQLIRRFAFYDPLTNLPNRRLLLERLQQNIATAKREGYNLAIFFLDLDKFKQINDQFGHLVGDQYLREFAQLVQSHLRESDTLARLGGDEFVALIPHIENAEVTRQLALKIMDKVMNHTVMIEEHSFQISVSMGGVLYPEHGDQPERLIELADRAMYRNKANKSEFTILFDSEPTVGDAG